MHWIAWRAGIRKFLRRQSLDEHLIAFPVIGASNETRIANVCRLFQPIGHSQLAEQRPSLSVRQNIPAQPLILRQ